MAGLVVRQFIDRASADGQRSTALKPVQWLFGISTSGVVLTSWTKGPTWVLIVLSVLACIAVALFLVGYIYFMLKSPDALRSERYSLSKMAIERGLVGDDVVGLIDRVDEGAVIAHPALPDKREGA